MGDVGQDPITAMPDHQAFNAIKSVLKKSAGIWNRLDENWGRGMSCVF